ncbi:SLC13 family permease [Tianweitania sediminis]|jgi:di/tricarboxylate transporter|uniref:SLC13 family permease n=1 Tax=Tianweitania sediminis TaxID=1502156 RepID=A0A8J7RPB1_9HYPH|nr:SLC13 family permease [Tianweitania sediminis]MBP0439524.1 SLC13 family permease [Tianweitania sediminis]HEV7418012.1 SLC13 family permease [Tianweitania sediminis]
MTLQQGLSFAVIFAMMAAFVWGRYRYDIVAVVSLLVAVAVGVVKPERAFSGFADDIVIIVGSALVVSAGVARSGITELLIQRYLPKITAVRMQLVLLVTVVTVLSGFVKNIGALAIMIPIAFQFAKRSNVSASVFLMPMAFGSLLGGLTTQIGTSPNIIVSRLRGELGGEPFTMFDFTPVGAALALIGIAFLAFGYKLLPQRQRETAAIHEAIDIKNYITEAQITERSALLGKTVADLLHSAEGNVIVSSILRQKTVKVTPLPDVTLREGDMLILEGEPEALDRLVAQEVLSVTGDRQVRAGKAETEIGAIEAVISENSILIGLSAKQLALFDRFNVNLLAVSRKGEHIKERLSDIRFRIGDVLVLQGDREALPAVLREFGCLPLAERSILLGSVRRGLVPLAILACAMGLTATGTVPVAIAFFAAAVAMVLFKVVPTREVYGAVDGPILVMLAALIPVSESLRETGATDLIAGGLVQVGQLLPGWGALGLIILVAMAITPFLNNAATVLVMAPIAASYASGLHFRPDAFLMAVAIGAGCDFLTPIGHQCNTLVMGPGGYRFSDYPRLGLPLSIIVVLAAVPLLMIVWPLT